MAEFSVECLNTFLENQDRLFFFFLSETIDEANAFLEDVMAEVVDSIDDVRDYLDQSGMDVDGMSDEEIEEAAEVFALPSGRYLIVEA